MVYFEQLFTNNSSVYLTLVFLDKEGVGVGVALSLLPRLLEAGLPFPLLVGVFMVTGVERVEPREFDRQDLAATSPSFCNNVC